MRLELSSLSFAIEVPIYSFSWLMLAAQGSCNFLHNLNAIFFGVKRLLIFWCGLRVIELCTFTFS